MTGKRHLRNFLPVRTRPVPEGHAPRGRAARRGGTRTSVLSAGALAACASLAVGCGVVPGTSGGGTDEPITVMTWAPEDTAATNKPGMPAMAQAYARWVNSRGGLDGRELRVLTCNDDNEAVGAAACAQRAVDEGAVAVVGSYSQHGRSFLSPLESAGIPYMGGYGVTSDEFTSSISYPVNGGQFSLLAGLGEQLADACGTVVLVRPDSVVGDTMPVLLDAGLRTGEHAAVTDQLAAEDATSYTDAAGRALARATSDTSSTGCVVPSLGDRTDTFMDSFRRVRDDSSEVRIGSVLGSVDQSRLDATGGSSGPYEGAYVTGWYPEETDARWNTMNEVIDEHAFGDNRIDASDPGVQTTWVAYTVFEAVVEKLGEEEISARSIRRALDDGLEVTTGGLTPTLRWRFEDLIAAGDFPRLVNSDVTFQVVRDGRLVAARKDFVNVRQTLENAG
ncbi:lipoprotein [Streptomyces ruber]|uniref:Lipoprotein n=2 Tax=Streptomyces TaxID=1883 RepID=A0A918B8S2_9ACTN|nr:ABC transporter substrate-binding protein [Streptomyces ruber]GGQ38271.1 lipoprotein [Streptomyces ruber]